MRVSVEHGTESTGLFKKTTYYTVTLKVVFTEEEAAILKQADLLDHIIMEREVPPNRHDPDGEGTWWHLSVKDLFNPKGDVYLFRTTGEAKRYEESLMEHMRLVKEVIDEHRDVEVESKTFEL